jgi:hypothetical protein
MTGLRTPINRDLIGWILVSGMAVLLTAVVLYAIPQAHVKTSFNN